MSNAELVLQIHAARDRAVAQGINRRNPPRFGCRPGLSEIQAIMDAGEWSSNAERQQDMEFWLRALSQMVTE